MLRTVLASVTLFAATACGGGPRASVTSAVEARDVARSLDEYDRFREDEGGGDPGLLALVAALILEQAVLEGSDAERDAAFHQLSLAGTAADPALERLAERADDPASRARALGVLVTRGDSGAKAELRGLLDSDDTRIVAEAARTLDAPDDTAKLLELLVHTGAAVRAAAARELRDAAPDGRVYVALAEAARVDPIPKVRAAAARSLGAFGAQAFETLRERLSDADQTVRMAAVGALVEADRAQALGVVGSLLDMAPSPSGIEAARVIAASGGEGADTARAFLRRALVSGEASVRSHAAVALSGLPDNDALLPALAEALESEREPEVRRALAGILADRPGTRDKALEALRAMIADEEGMARVQAAAVLAEHEPSAAIPVLREAMERGEPDVRRTAARALARDALSPDAARTALRDEDALVRIHAAGGILAASNTLD